MAIIQTITQNQFAQALLDDQYASWSYAGACALYDWLEEINEGSDTNYELDVVGLRCKFSEYSSIKDCAEACFGDNWEDVVGYDDKEHDEEEIEELILEHLSGYTSVIRFGNGVIIADF